MELPVRRVFSKPATHSVTSLSIYIDKPTFDWLSMKHASPDQAKRFATTDPKRLISWISVAMLSVLLILLAQPARAADDTSKAMKTVGGVLQVANDKEEGFGQKLLLNKKPVVYMEGSNMSELSDDIVELQEKYSIKGNDVVMLYTTCSGNACTLSTVYLVTVTPAGKVSVAGGISAGEGGLLKEDVKVVGDTLELQVTEFISPRKSKTVRWVLADGKLARRK